jgi:hypothetical protein
VTRVRKGALLLGLIVLVLGVAACGGGGSSSSSTTTASKPAASGPEAAWAKEVEAVMRRFEGRAAPVIELVHTSTSQAHLEPLYRAYGAALTKLGDELEATDAPKACLALRKRMGEDAHALGRLTTKLGHEGNVSQEEFSALVVQQEAKTRRYGRELTAITYKPHC